MMNLILALAPALWGLGTADAPRGLLAHTPFPQLTLPAVPDDPTGYGYSLDDFNIQVGIPSGGNCAIKLGTYETDCVIDANECSVIAVFRDGSVVVMILKFTYDPCHVGKIVTQTGNEVTFWATSDPETIWPS